MTKYDYTAPSVRFLDRLCRALWGPRWNTYMDPGYPVFGVRVWAVALYHSLARRAGGA